MSDTHKKSETNQQVSDFHTTEGSVNGSLTDRHYSQSCLFFYLLAATPGSQPPPTRLLISCFLQVASSPACWRGFFISDISLLMEAVKKINGVEVPYGAFLVH
ncbi:hypothetical protein [Aeromonas veronii]|uniref:hypothetical protein n=1 Tax=Aeromonas veronii TaxID=654 RepID=UPI0013159E61|nr:hypothetical protein [Aeromonas veronii]